MLERQDQIGRVGDSAERLPSDPIERCAFLMESGESLESYRTWFTVDPELRDSAVRSAIQNAPRNISLKSIRESNNTPSRDKYLFHQFPVLFASSAQKLLAPKKNEEITRRDYLDLQEEGHMYFDFLDLLEDENRTDLFITQEEFSNPKLMLQLGLSTDEMRDVLITALSHVKFDQRLHN